MITFSSETFAIHHQHPLFSAPSLILTAIFLFALGLGIWIFGGLVFSPGALSAQASSPKQSGGYQSHVDFEKQCRLCHRPLEKNQDDLCLECHRDIAEQLQTSTGLHGRLENVHPCRTCHSEHQGKEYNLISEAMEKFDHETTAFSLVWHQQDYAQMPIHCTGCHVPGGNFSADLKNCASCHADYDPSFMRQHLQDFGENCLACHDGRDRMANFDHARTNFPLDGRHANLNCTACHASQGAVQAWQNFASLPTGCAGCHAEPELHRGLFNQDCAECHTPQDWHKVNWQGQPFEHFSNTGFSLARHTLDYSGQPMRCTSCHTSSLEQLQAAACLDCHDQHDPVFMQSHQEQFGRDCLGCHDGVDRMANFDHASVFLLDGAHIALQCRDCHSDDFIGTSSACVSCHAEPEIHAGFFGLECQNCHTTQAWSPALLKSHAFPLDHGSAAPLSCQTCHPARYTEYTCYRCHEHQPAEILEEHLDEGISQAELPDCTRCHPTGREEE
jgi:hypothetical protein